MDIQLYPPKHTQYNNIPVIEVTLTLIKQFVQDLCILTFPTKHSFPGWLSTKFPEWMAETLQGQRIPGYWTIMFLSCPHNIKLKLTACH